MRMKNPCHPGELILSNMEAVPLGVEEAAPRLGVTCEELTSVINGESPVTAALAVRLGEVFGGGVEIWRRLQESYNEAQERNRYDAPGVANPWIPSLEQATVPLRNGFALYTTYDDAVLRFRYLKGGNTVLPWYSDETYDQVEIRFGGPGPGALQVQLVHQPRSSEAPRLVAEALFRVFLVWTGDPDGRPLARVDARMWDKERSKVRAGRRMMRDLYAGLAKPGSFPIFADEKPTEKDMGRQASILKEAEALEKHYSKVIRYMAFAGV